MQFSVVNCCYCLSEKLPISRSQVQVLFYVLFILQRNQNLDNTASMVLSLMNNALQIILKKAVMVHSRHYSGICLKGQWKSTKNMKSRQPVFRPRYDRAPHECSFTATPSHSLVHVLSEQSGVFK